MYHEFQHFLKLLCHNGHYQKCYTVKTEGDESLKVKWQEVKFSMISQSIYTYIKKSYKMITKQCQHIVCQHAKTMSAPLGRGMRKTIAKLWSILFL